MDGCHETGDNRTLLVTEIRYGWYEQKLPLTIASMKFIRTSVTAFAYESTLNLQPIHSRLFLNSRP